MSGSSGPSPEIAALTSTIQRAARRGVNVFTLWNQIKTASDQRGITLPRDAFIQVTAIYNATDRG